MGIKGIVTKSTGSWYQVKLADGSFTLCRIKGKIRLDDIKHTNPIAVGDEVEFEYDVNEENGVIKTILPRKNYIIRKSSNLSKQTHILASNLNQAMLVATIVNPVTSLGFIDRFLITAEAYHIKPVLVFNKVDLYKNELADILSETIYLYTKIGYQCLTTSVLSHTGLAELINTLKNKTTLIAGHSGVGKSSLLNSVSPGLSLKTGAISTFSNKGKHTTTFAEMFELNFGGSIIDTPGIKEFGLVELSDSEIGQYFIEFRPYLQQCKFNNCLHLNEPNCAVKAAVETGEIHQERYTSYQNMLTKADLYQ